MLATVSRALSLIGLVTAPLAAEVVRIEVHSRADAANKRASARPVPDDPTLPAHTILTDIDKPAWNANGKVECLSDLSLIAPKRIERGNGAVLWIRAGKGHVGMAWWECSTMR